MFDCNRPGSWKDHAAGLIAVVCLPLLFGACSEKKPEELLASAKTYLAKGDRKAAVIQIKNAIQADSKSGEARYLLGVALLDEGDPVQAELELRKAQRLDYSADLVVPKLATSLLAHGESKKVIDEFGASRLVAPAARVALATSLASAHAALGDASQADAKLGDALAVDPAYVPALLLRARLRMAVKNFAEASNIVAAVLRSTPESAESWKLKGDIEDIGAQNSGAALDSYRKAVAAKTDFVPARLSIVRLLIRDGKFDDAQKEIEALTKIAPRDTQVKYVQAVAAYSRKDLKAAQDLSAQLLKAAPNNVQALILAASVELDTHSTSMAQIHLARALELAPENLAARRLLMVAALRAGQPGQAIAALYRGLPDKQVNPELYSMAGEAYMQSGDAKTAQQFFAKAAKLDPKDARKRTSLAMARLSEGDTGAAFEELQNVAASDTGTSADVALITAYMSQSQMDKALKAIDVLERKQPDQPLASYFRGRVELSLRDGAAARKSFSRALALAPTYFPAAASLTAMDLAENKVPDAKARLVQLLAKDPTNSKALMALAEVNAKAGASKEETAATIDKAIGANPSDPAPRLMLVEAYFRAGDAKQAVAAAQSAVAALPDDPTMRDALGRAQLQSGDVQQAISSLSKAAEMQPGSARPYLRLAGAQLANKSLTEGEQSLQRALAIQPDLLDAQRALASVYVDTGKSTAALRIARTIQTQRPKEGVGYALEGDIEAFQKNAAAAEAAYRAGLKQVPDTELAIKLHGFLARSSAPDAERFASQWQKQRPKDVGFLFYLGDTALMHKDFDSAKARYKAVVAIEPDHAPAINNLAWLANERHEADALALAERANRLAPNEPSFMDTLATVLASGQQYVEAIKVQRRAMALRPEDPALRLGLVKIYLKAGDKSNARANLDQLVALGPKFAGQAEASKLLHDL